MSLPTLSPDQQVQHHARVAALEALLDHKTQEISAAEAKLRVVQGNLLKAQVQIMELGDLLAARDTALKNAQAGAPDLQRILDTELARTNQLDAELRAANDRYAAAQLELAAEKERATAAERTSREVLATAQRENQSLITELATAKNSLALQGTQSARFETIANQLKADLVQAQEITTRLQQSNSTLEGERTGCSQELQKIKKHWIWRLTGPLHD